MPKKPSQHRRSKQHAAGLRFGDFANDHGPLGAIIMRVPASGKITIPKGIPTGDGLDIEETLLTDYDMKHRVPADMVNRILNEKEIEERLQ